MDMAAAVSHTIDHAPVPEAGSSSLRQGQPSREAEVNAAVKAVVKLLSIRCLIHSKRGGQVEHHPW
jgi:hypothetical protein